MLDIWVCSNCHSINRERSKSCYKCGGPRTAATGEGAQLRPGRALQARLASPYRRTTFLAILTGLFILVVVGLQVYATVLEFKAIPIINDGLDRIAAGQQIDQAPYAPFADADQVGLMSLAAYIVATIAFGAWLSLVVSNVPGLGGGDPPVGPTRVFAYTLIPLLNLRKMPRIIQDTLNRLDPRGGGIFMVGLAWIGLVGSWIVSRIIGFYLGIRLAVDIRNANSLSEVAASLKQLLGLAFVIDVVLSALITIGALTLVAIVAEIERRAEARNREVNELLGSAG